MSDNEQHLEDQIVAIDEAERQIDIDENENTDLSASEECCVKVCSILTFILFPITCFCCFSIINQVERGVIFRFGRLKDKKVSNPGVQFLLPMIDEMHKIDVRSKLFDIQPQSVLKILSSG